MMKKQFTLLFCALILGFSSFGQSKNAESATDYNSAFGLRLGYPLGLTFKTFTSQHSAVEFLAGYWYGGVNVTGLYEYHGDISGAPGLKWFVGGGLDFSYWNNYSYSGPAFAIDLIGGLDYKFNNAPLNVSLDWKPAFYVAGERGFRGTGAAVSLRYTF